VLLLALMIVFIAVPIAELYVLIWVVGPALGAPLTILLLIADSVLGSVLMRSQGRAVWSRFNRTLGEGRMPHREVIDGVLVIFGGALLITPGFITDIFGFLLLLPPTRALFRRLLVNRLGRRLVISGWRSRDGARQAYDVEGSATEYSSTPPPRLGR
jgi:UPF0716 protein FxsA